MARDLAAAIEFMDECWADVKRAAEARADTGELARLRERLATALCSTFDLGHHHHEAFLQPDHCDDGLADADQLLPYLAVPGDAEHVVDESDLADLLRTATRRGLIDVLAEERWSDAAHLIDEAQDGWEPGIGSAQIKADAEAQERRRG